MSQYYDSENISESKLSFRRATSDPDSQDTRSDSVSMQMLYGLATYVNLHLRLFNSADSRVW